MYKDLLPIGSIVRLTDGEKKVMICGRVVCQGDNNQIYDYAGCVYPQGIVDSNHLFFFNKDAIAEFFFIGFQDREEMDFRHGVLDQLGELKVLDGQIVPDEQKDTK